MQSEGTGRGVLSSSKRPLKLVPLSLRRDSHRRAGLGPSLQGGVPAGGQQVRGVFCGKSGARKGPRRRSATRASGPRGAVNRAAAAAAESPGPPSPPGDPAAPEQSPAGGGQPGIPDSTGKHRLSPGRDGRGQERDLRLSGARGSVAATVTEEPEHQPSPARSRTVKLARLAGGRLCACAPGGPAPSGLPAAGPRLLMAAAAVCGI